METFILYWKAVASCSVSEWRSSLKGMETLVVHEVPFEVVWMSEWRSSLKGMETAAHGTFRTVTLAPCPNGGLP